MDLLTDVQLWEQARAGDAEAFGALYERHARSVQSFCMWWSADQQAAEDAAATVFLEVWRQRSRLVLTTDSAAPLLLGVATNVLRGQRRARRRHAAAVERIHGTAGSGSPDHADDVIARMEAARRLREGGAAIRALPRREREVLALLAWGELSYVEIAAALGVPIGTVRSRLARGRARLGDSFHVVPSASISVEDPLR